jgi:hypothetical protein
MLLPTWNYPMFSLAHVLGVRIREALGQGKDTELKLAAIYAADRRKLYELVTEVTPPVEVEEEPVMDEPEGIRFSDEPNMEADVIIEHHAPYAAPAREGSLLELDEETEIEDMSPESSGEKEEYAEDEGGEDRTGGEEDSQTEDHWELSSETLIEAVVKDEADLEDPDTEEEAPAIDVVETHTDEEITVSDEEVAASDEEVTVSDEEGSGSAEGIGPAEEEKVAGPETADPRELKNRLIRNFIMGDPGPIRADRDSGLKGDVSLASIREHDGFITDTLAKIYVKQGLYAKAIYAYEKLSLKYPEKSAYFAAQIEKIRNIKCS